MAKLKRKVFRVSVVMPVGGTIAQMRAFIEEAVTSYRHNLMNGEPEYEIDLKAIKVTALREPR